MQTLSGQRLSGIFVKRLDHLVSLWSSGSGSGQEFRQSVGGLHDAASLLGLDELARGSMDLLGQGAGEAQALREWLPSAGVIETRLAGIATAAHTSYPEFYAEPALVVLTADPDPHFAARELAADLGDRAVVVDTPVAAVTEVSAQPDASIIVAVDEATVADDAVEYLGRELRPALRARRLGMLLISKNTEFDRLRRSNTAGHPLPFLNVVLSLSRRAVAPRGPACGHYSSTPTN